MDEHGSCGPPYTIQRVPSSDPIVLTTILSLFDESVAWLTAKGVSAQWGSKPLANNENHIGKVKKIIEVCLFLASVPSLGNRLAFIMAVRTMMFVLIRSLVVSIELY